jgi:hypothetical protein
VKAIRNLDRVRRTFRRPARIVRRTIPGNDLDPGVRPQPRRDGVCGALGQHIDRLLPFKIHQDRAIDTALPEGKIIDAKHARSTLGGSRSTAENPQDRIATEGYAQAGRHPCSRFTAGLTPEDTDGLGQPRRALCMARRERREAFRKSPAGTRGGGTAETPDMDPEAHGVVRDWQVTQAARIAAMHTGRRGVTIWTGGIGRTGVSLDQERRIGR